MAGQIRSSPGSLFLRFPLKCFDKRFNDFRRGRPGLSKPAQLKILSLLLLIVSNVLIGFLTKSQYCIFTVHRDICFLLLKTHNEQPD